MVRVHPRELRALARSVLAGAFAFRLTRTADPIAQCAAQLEYWIGERLSGAPDRGYEYQGKGLSGVKYEALNAILDRADAPPTADPAAATWAHAQAQAACVEIAARPTSTVSRGGWP